MFAQDVEISSVYCIEYSSNRFFNSNSSLDKELKMVKISFKLSDIIHNEELLLNKLIS